MKSSFIRSMELWLATALLAVMLGSAAWAHPGHGEAIAQEEATKRANGEISRLVEAGKLERSWLLESKLQTAELRPRGPAREWVLIFGNEKAADADKRTLYVFLSESGEYLAANFTGR